MRNQLPGVRCSALLTAMLASLGGISDTVAGRSVDASHVRQSLESGGRPGAEGVSNDLATLLEGRAADAVARGSSAPGLAPRMIGDDVIADVVLRGDATDLVQRIEAAGGVVRAISGKYLRASVLVSDMDEAARIAALPEVRRVGRDYGPVTRVGAVTSRAVRALNVTPIAGAPSNLTGAGQRIGILSDSFTATSGPDGVVDGDTTTDGTSVSPSGNSSPVILRNSRPQDSGDLPSQVELRRDDASGTLLDEGAAMAELAYDIAPNADISFYTASFSFAEFAAGVDDLCTSRNNGGAGATVLVDDVGYPFTELMYQPDILAQEITDCVDRGRPYFSAAGNDGDSGFRLEYVDIDAAANDDSEINADADGYPGGTDPDARDFHDWGAGTPGLRIDLDVGESIGVILQWNQPALSTPQNSSNGPQIDLDLYLSTDNTIAGFFANVIASSFNFQLPDQPGAGDDPIERLVYTRETGDPGTVYLGIDHWGGSRFDIPQSPGTPLEFRLVILESGGNGAVYDPMPNGPTIIGHPAADGAVSVAAVPWWEAPFYDPEGTGSLDIDPRSFSSRGGPIPYFFRADGTFAKSTTNEPDLAAVDGNNTTFFGQDGTTPSIDSEPDGFPNFSGTSAAAPNAAGVAALLLEDDCKQSPAELVAKLQDAAVDVTGDRAAPGDDDVTGSGLIDAGSIPLEGGTAQCNGGDGGGGGGSTGWLTLIGLVALLARRRKL